MSIEVLVVFVLSMSLIGCATGIVALVTAIKALRHSPEQAWIKRTDQIALGQQGQESAIVGLSRRVSALEERVFR